MDDVTIAFCVALSASNLLLTPHCLHRISPFRISSHIFSSLYLHISEGKTLVVQYAVKHPQNIDCGGGYIKLLPAGLNQATFNGDSPYSIMFGPDICGTATRRIHVIFNHPEKGNLLVKKDIRCESDRVNHVYTLIVNGADRTYEVKVDGVRRDGGKLEDDWEFTAPRKIKDPSQSKPADWVDDAMMDDPSDVKPADWDSIPKQINDPEAVKPADWDDDADGTWEAPKIDNPAWKGEWKPKRIANPAYKGPWEHPMIDNPDYKEDTSIGQYKNLNYVGFELWQVKAGSIFSNILITDDVTKAEEAAKEIVNRSAAEKKALDDIEAAKREKEEAAKKEAEAAAAAAAPAKEAVDEDEKPKPKDSKDEL